MKNNSSGFLIVLCLTLLSLFLYAVQLLVFGSPRDTGFYLLQDFAFLPLQIAIVTVVLGRYLKRREKLERLKKIDVVINAFFSEAGRALLENMTGFSKNRAEFGDKLNVMTNWSDKMFSQTVREIESADIPMACSVGQLESLKALMKNKRDFLIMMIENPNLLEHETFTDMILSVFHIAEELLARSDFEDANMADMAHLSGDIQRAFRALLIQWVEYMRHLRTEYPYLYSLEIRKNPFRKENSVIIRD